MYGIIILVGPITGAALNPAREIGPALLGQAHRRASPVPLDQLVVVYIVGSTSVACRCLPVRVHRPRGDRAVPDAAGPRGCRRRLTDPLTPDHHRRRRHGHQRPSRVKKLINDVEDIVPESLAGLGAAHPDLVKIDLRQNLVLRAGGPKKGKVALISGGGSGHEPLHGGFVGLGMLDAAAAGHVFTSPVPDQMEAATRAVDGGAGVLHIVKNYTGDVLNFQMAAELVAGEIEVATVVTNDDVAVQDSLYTAGRRGVGVTVLLEKIAGAHAEAGGSLADVTATATKVNAQGRSMGLALTSCIVPGRRHADVRARRRRGRGRDRHPRRARPAPREARAGRRDGRVARLADRLGPRADARRHRARLRQRDGRHAAHRAVRRVQQRRQDPGRPGHHRSAARSSATTSRAWRWPASRSRSCGSTMS